MTRDTNRRRTVYEADGASRHSAAHLGNCFDSHRQARLCGDEGGLLIGVDLQKDRHVIEAAYNDSAGVTAEFNLNLLVRANRELGADFDLAAWRLLPSLSLLV